MENTRGKTEMNRLLVMTLMSGIMLFGQKLADFEPFEKNAVNNAEKSTIVSLDFEDGIPSGMELAKGYKCGRGFGENGNGGLILQRGPGEEYVFSRLLVTGMKAGNVYRFSASVKLEGVRMKDGKLLADRQVPVVGFDFHDSKRNYLSSSYFSAHVKNGECDWQHLEGTFAMEGTKPILVFFLKDFSCTACQWDNVSIKLEGKQENVIYPILPKMLRIDTDGTVKMRTALMNKEEDEKDFVLFAQLPDKREFVSNITDSISHFKLGQLPEGVTKVRFLLGDRKSGRIVTQVEYPFQFTTATPPEGTVSLDESGRAFIDGKPFFPLGMFWENVNMMPPDIERMKSMGVNCVLPYRAFRFRLPEKQGPNTSIAEIRRSMDILHKNGMKLIFSMLDVYGRLGDVKRFEGVEGMDNIIRVTVNGLKDHPALLGWYISDENPLSDLPMLLNMRFLISELDPFHPVYTLTNHTRDYVLFAPTGDVFLADCYPISNEQSQSMSAIRNCFIASERDSRIGLWWLPQIFNWGIYRCPKTKQPYSDTRYPTEEEMRSHNLLSLNHRARAVIPYAYNSVGRHDAYDPGASQRFWPLVSNVMILLKELEPFFIETAESTKLFEERIGASVVEARLHTADNQRQIVVITADGPGEVKAVIKVGRKGWKSRFGHTKDLGDGSYEFTASNTASDVLELKP